MIVRRIIQVHVNIPSKLNDHAASQSHCHTKLNDHVASQSHCHTKPMPLLHRVGEHAEDDGDGSASRRPRGYCCLTVAAGTSGSRPITRDGFSSRATKEEDQNEMASGNIPEEKENIMGGPLSC